jgi:hypothetical protein
LVTQSYSLHEMAVTAFRTARKLPQITSTTQEIEPYKLMSNFPDPTQHRSISNVPVVQSVRTLQLLQQQRPTILHVFKTPPKRKKRKKKKRLSLRGTAGETISLTSSSPQLMCRVTLPLPSCIFLCIFMRISRALRGILQIADRIRVDVAE